MSNRKGNPEIAKYGKRFSKDSERSPSIEGKKGAIKSNEVQRKKKALKQALEIILELKTKKAIEFARQEGREDTAKELEDGGILAVEIARTAFSNKAKPETKLKAMDMIADRTEGKPVQQNINVERHIEMDEDRRQSMEEAAKSYLKKRERERMEIERNKNKKPQPQDAEKD